MAKKTSKLTPAQKQRMQKNMKKIVPPAVGMKKVASKALGRAVPGLIKIAGQAKKIRVKNTGNARQVPRTTRKPRFRIKKR